MMRTINIDNLQCLCSGPTACRDKIAYILYPVSGLLDGWIERAAENHGVTIVAVTGMDWQNVFSPWPARGVPAGSPDFKGESPEFLQTLRNRLIPSIELELGMADSPGRTLVGVSMSGLFAVWQWMLCDIFTNIASLSGSFWYEGFMTWMSARPIPAKGGTAFFLIGRQEVKSRVKAFVPVMANTEALVGQFAAAGINVDFKTVEGNHYSDPLPRLDAAFRAIYD